MIAKKYILKFPNGLHARPCSMIMGRLRGLNLESTYLLWRGSRADMRSIIETLQLGMPYLEEFSVEISGPDEKKAIEFLDSFFNLEIPYE